MNTQTLHTLHIGLTDAQRKTTIQGLSRLLADTYSLYLKTHYFHWNVTGPYFKSLHELFETQYTELALAVDTLAERIRALGAFAPGSFKAFAELRSIPDVDGVPAWDKMVKFLLTDHESVVCALRAFAEKLEGDEATLNLLADRMEIHEKTAWMLRSHLE